MSNKKITFLCFLLFHTSFIYLGIESTGRVIQLFCLLLFIVLFNTKIFYLFRYNDKKLIRIILFYITTVLVTSLLSKNIDTSYLMGQKLNPIKDIYAHSSYSLGIMCATITLMYFSFIYYLNRINKTEYLGKVFFKLCLFYCITADIFVFIVGVNNSTFISGGKFGISYLHMFLVMFYYLKNNMTNSHVNNNKYYIYILFSIAISIYTECTTALLGNFIMLLAFKYKSIIIRKFFKPHLILYSLMCCAFFPLFVSYIINNSLVTYIIVDILGEDLTLTGRIGIYETLGDIIFLRPIWGFGIGNAHNIMAYLYGTANAQNGIANLILEQGFVGVIAVIMILMTCLKRVNYQKNINTVFAVYLILFILVIMSTVEITIDYKFIIITSFLLVKKSVQHQLN